jgi:dCMP deaminase
MRFGMEQDIKHAARVQARPSFPDIYMDLAHALAKRSTCRRLNVGCVIVSTDFRKVLAVGYNGGASGGVNDCDSEEVGRCGCLHAEENAIINCDSPRTMEKFVLCTNLPCPMCAKRLVNLGGVVQVTYREDYRVRDGLGILTRGGIITKWDQR